MSSDSSITANAGTNLNTSALALESGGNLASINTKIPVLGQALAGASVPVVLPAAQITTLTPPTTVTVTQATASALNATVIGTTAAGSGAASGLVTVQGNASGTPVPVSGTVTTTPSGEQNVNLNQVGGSAIAIGQQLSAASLPVVLPASQITSLTPPTTVTVTQTTAANLNATVVGAGTAGTPSGGVVSVQGVSGGTPQPVLISSQTLPSAPIAGQTTSTGTAVALASSTALTQGVIIQALATNVGNVYLGPSSVTTSTGFQLQPGQATSVAVNNLNVVYLIAATSGDGVCYIGS